MPTFTPDADTAIARKYDAKTLEGKMQNKAALQEELGWPTEPKRAIMCLPTGMTDQLGGALLKDLIPGLLSLPVNIVILGKGSAAFGSLFTELSRSEKHRVAIVPSKEDMIHKMYAGADMALFLADTEGMDEVNHCLRYGVIPVAPEGTLLENYNPNQESGTAFTYGEPTIWNAFGALVRALETFKFPFDWRTIQRHCMEAVA